MPKKYKLLMAGLLINIALLLVLLVNTYIKMKEYETQAIELQKKHEIDISNLRRTRAVSHCSIRESELSTTLGNDNVIR